MTAREKLLAEVSMDPKRWAPMVALALAAAAETADDYMADQYQGATAVGDALRALAAEVEGA